jgi:hypothetical protein
MKTPFLHEHHNRQDKATKPDYRPEMIAKGPAESLPTPSSRLTERAAAREELLQEIRKQRFVLQGYNFKFGWTLEVFARKNSLQIEDTKTKAAMQLIQQAAERDVAAFTALIKTAPIRRRGIMFYFDYPKPPTECQMFPK